MVAAIEGLSAFPERSPLAKEAAAVGQEVRELIVGRRAGCRRVVFVVREGRVFVLRVRHGARSDAPPGDLRLEGRLSHWPVL